MKKVEILNIETTGLEKPLTGSNMRRNGFSLENDHAIKSSGIKEEAVDFWVFRPELTLDKEKLVKVVESIKKILKIKFFQQKVLELNLENAMILVDSPYSKSFFLSMTVGETLILMSKRLDLEVDSPDNFHQFFAEYKKKCQTLRFYKGVPESKEVASSKPKPPAQRLKKEGSPERIGKELPETLKGESREV